LIDLISAGAYTHAITTELSHLSDFKNNDLVTIYACNLTDDIQVKNTCQQITQNFGVDIIINCAGTSIDGNIDEISDADFFHVFDLNLFAAFRVIKYCLPSMKSNNGGVILNVASALASRAAPYCSAYAASKSAIVHFTKCLSLELAPWKIRANCISPGYFLSSLTREFITSDSGKTFINNQIPMRRLLDLHELIPMIRLMISGAGSYMTGANIVIDGGLSNW